MKKATTLDDFNGVQEKPQDFTPKDMTLFADMLKDKFGEFSRRALNKFYQKANIAKVAWAMRKQDGSIEKLPFGKIISAIQYPEMKHNKIWLNYTLATDFPLLFWEDLYDKTCKYFAKIEYVEQKKLESLAELEATIGEEIHE